MRDQDPKSDYEPDRRANATGAGPARAPSERDEDELFPGERGGGTIGLPGTGETEAHGTGAAEAEGTIGAVGEMDVRGVPVPPTETASTRGLKDQEGSEGGGPGGGSLTRGGTGEAPSGHAPQSVEATVDVLNEDDE
jgi:hypothetical protein